MSKKKILNINNQLKLIKALQIKVKFLQSGLPHLDKNLNNQA